MNRFFSVSASAFYSSLAAILLVLFPSCHRLDERMEIAVTQPKRVLTSMVVPHLAPRLGDLSCPVFAFWGMNDKFCPVSGATTIAER